jgi:protein tyrosine phosphatase (PTP) superfamily phosphohydrolase (DUF442 family)
MFNTLRTLVGYAGTLIAKYTGYDPRGGQLDDIFNYVAISDRIGTSGQPTKKQFAAIKSAGFSTVINLLPADSENALKGEPDVVRGLGLDYVYIPVDFKGPTENDFTQFVEAMQAHQDSKVWVHCAVNARVSVFVARYRNEVEGLDRESTREPIAQVWEPWGVWTKFLDGEKSA